MRSSIRKSDSTTNQSTTLLTILVGIALSIALTSEAHAQSFTPLSQGRTVAHAGIGGVMKPILSVRPIGQPVRLEDGRVEQRYEVTANVAFRLVSATGAGDEVRCADATREVPLTQLEGRAGFHTELRVRAANESALAVTAEQR